MNLLFHRWNVTTLDVALEIAYCQFNMRIADNDLIRNHIINSLRTSVLHTALSSLCDTQISINIC